jgi:hypothetical protein
MELWQKKYLDNCAYNRPFDDQTQVKIALETEAKRYIQWSREYFANYDPVKFLKDAVEYDKNNPQ